ncbi:protein UmuC-like protein [Klebsiella aerogenes]|nr:protein UmuC-like protein [Klebsiella aerogenes]
MFALVDVNNFYTSCETVFRPDLKGKPIVVVSNNDGCIISRSAEAKSLGIKNGEPFFKIKNNLIIPVFIFSVLTMRFMPTSVTVLCKRSRQCLRQ